MNGKFKIIVAMLIFIEAILYLPFQVRAQEQAVDEMIVRDKQSEDNTTDVLKCGLEEILYVEESTQAEWIILDESLQEKNIECSKEYSSYWEKFSSDYYYNQLGNTGKAMWDALEKSCISIMESQEYCQCVYASFVNTDELTFEEISQIVYLFKFSNPQYYFLESEFSSAMSSNDVLVKIKIYDGFYDGMDRNKATKEFKSQIDEWTAQVAQVPRDEDKLKKAYDIIAENVSYDYMYDSIYNQSAYSAVVEGITVCAGYAATIQMLLNANGIETIEVISDNHGWNLVELHDYWYIVDITWDDNGDYSRYDYYGKSAITVSELDQGNSHTIRSEWQKYVPELKNDLINKKYGNKYLSAYFTIGNNIYFRVNDEINRGVCCAKKVDVVNPEIATLIPRYVDNNNKSYYVLDYDPNSAILESPVLQEDNSILLKVNWKEIENADNGYDVLVLRDGETFVDINQKENEFCIFKLIEDGGSATYRVKIRAATTNYFEPSAWSEYVYKYIEPAKKLDKPKEVWWSTDGMINWNLVEEASRYNIVLYKDGNIINDFVGVYEKGECDLNSYLQNGAEYVVKVRAVTDNLNNISSSEFTTSNVYEMTNKGKLVAFVDRMYTVALNRPSDETGKANWVTMLNAGTHDGAGIAREFILGEEFGMRGLSNEEFVDVLYQTFFNREADTEGKNLWVTILESGQTREYVLSNFVNLDEFTMLCDSYGIERGVMFENGIAANPGVPQFVNRLYEKVMGRNADAAGLYNWVFMLVVKAETAESAAVNFFNAEEYSLKNADSVAYVTDLYSVFMDREADSEGLALWVSFLDDYGMTRDWVISEFAKSAEFKAIAASYGLE